MLYNKSMKTPGIFYKIIRGTFIRRINRFVAAVEIDGREELVHVKNTGRCIQHLVSGAAVSLCEGTTPARKTRYDLIAAENPELGWVNLDSNAPNVLAHEWLKTCGFEIIKPEYRYGASRIDFYMERGGQRFLMEVKGCTQQFDGIGYFPDAPTERGVKHLGELALAACEGFVAIVAFVIPMNGIEEVLPNCDIHPEFGMALEQAVSAGVHQLFLRCNVTENSVEIVSYRYDGGQMR